jgi:hypothetical protein
MRTTLTLIAVLLCNSADALDDPKSANSPEQPAAQGATDAQATPAATTGEAWRYRRHNGRWWYWLPSNRWVVWTGDKWVDHDSTTQPRAAQAQPRRSNSYPDNQGNWGPIRYDRWGQPEYPYSKRKSGLRQLGPVPAMGGVRSLPGWGGER